ncbi:FecCD family ABC transporter permease [Georgenia faecalis]|uniref:FecCD family ABC transporter permease n=1 Tax=Georgenia faecalis TaxID=2483799 RepID=A0ABV9DA42_9MICO|nr:iron ABC transporter permease [Georgenia faecalis]
MSRDAELVAPTTAPPDPGDRLGVRARARRNGLVLAVLAVLTVVTAIIAIAVGAVYVPPATVTRILAHAVLSWPGPVTWVPDQEAIVWSVRAPRVVLALAVGAGLAVCGTALQAMTRNMLADPYVLGINSGASCGAAAAILFGVGLGLGEYALSGSAFIGALAASLLVFAVARTAGTVTSVRLLLAGVAVGYALSAATSFLIFASGSAEGARSVMFWLLGSLALAQWGPSLLVVVVVVAVTCVALYWWAPGLDALAIGDETARTLGISPAAFRTRLLVLVALAVGVLVAASGSIGFVGLVVPHLARRVVGVGHRWVVPVSALLGATLLLWGDLLSRLVMAPQELPIGIVTALVGAPLLLHLVRTQYSITLT